MVGSGLNDAEQVFAEEDAAASAVHQKSVIKLFIFVVAIA